MKFNKLAALFTVMTLCAGLAMINASPALATPNASNEVIFFDRASGHNAIKRMRFDGTSKMTYDISALITTPDIRFMTSDGTKLYFANNSDGIYSMNMDGSGLTKIATVAAQDLAIYGAKLYYTTWSGGLYSVNLDGTGTSTLALASTFPSGTSGLRNIYVDGTYVWVTQGNGGGDGHLYRVSIAGGTPVLSYTSPSSTGIDGIAADGDNIFVRETIGGRVLGLSRSQLIAGTQATVPFTSALYGNNSGSALRAVGGKLYANTNQEINEFDLSTYNPSAPSALTASPLALQAAFPSALVGPMVVFVAKRIQYDPNGGTGNMASQSTAFSTTLTTNSYTKTDHVFAYWYTNNTCSTGGEIVNNAAAYSPSADVTLYACWRGAVAVSLSAGGATIDTYDFGNVQTGSTNSVTLYLSNLGDVSSRSLSFSNASISSGVFLSYGGGTCNFSGGNLVIGTPCTTVVTWNPTAAANLSPSTHSLTVQAGAFYDIKFSGTALVPRVVIFDANLGSGSMNSQSGIASQNLSSNTLTRSGYTFNGWNTLADGSGTSYADGAAYPFSASATLYAKWTAIPVVVTPTAPAAPPAPAGPQIVAPSKRVFTEGESQALTIEGQRFDDLESVTINGTTVKVLSSDSGSIKLDLGGLAAGTYTINFKFKAGSLVYQDAITVKPKALPTAPVTTPVRKMAKLVPGFDGDSAKLTSAVKANIGALLKSIPAAHSLVCTGSTSNTKITRADIALAKARATAACGYAKNLLPDLKTQTKLNPASGAAASARNVLLNISE